MIQNPERHARILRHTPPPPPSSLTWDPAGREREGEGLDTLCAKGGRARACRCRGMEIGGGIEGGGGREGGVQGDWRRGRGLTTPIVAIGRAWALARLITSERPFDDHDRPSWCTWKGDVDRRRGEERMHARACVCVCVCDRSRARASKRASP